MIPFLLLLLSGCSFDLTTTPVRRASVEVVHEPARFEVIDTNACPGVMPSFSSPCFVLRDTWADNCWVMMGGSRERSAFGPVPCERAP